MTSQPMTAAHAAVAYISAVWSGEPELAASIAREQRIDPHEVAMHAFTVVMHAMVDAGDEAEYEAVQEALITSARGLAAVLTRLSIGMDPFPEDVE